MAAPVLVAATHPRALAAEPAAAGDAAARPAAAVSDRNHSDRTVRITWAQAPGVDAPDFMAAWARVRQPDVLGPIAQETVGLSPELAAYVLKDPVMATSGNGVELVLGFDLNPQTFPKARPASKEFADKVVARFTQLLRDERSERENEKVAQAEQATQYALGEYDDVVRKLRTIQKDLGGQAPETARAALAKLEDERQRIELELAGIQARQKAVGDWIDRATKQLQEQAKSDPIVAELEKAVAAQEKFLDVIRKQVDAGVANPSAVADAESKLSDVRVQLLERKRGGGTNSSGNGDPLAALNRELQNLSIDIVDRRARLEFVEKRLAGAQQAVQGASDYELLESERQSLRQELERARQELRSARRTAQAAQQFDRVIITRSVDSKYEEPKEGASPQ
jgi:hypothetical protein